MILKFFKRMDLRLILSIFVILGAGACSQEDTRSDTVEVMVNPSAPMVVTAPTYDGATKIEPPWFHFSVTIDNQSDLPLVITALSGKTYLLGEGVNEGSDFALAAGEFNTSMNNISCTYVYFEIIPAKQKSILSIDNGIAGCPSGGVGFQLHSLKKPTNNVGDMIPRYRVVLKPLGWFGSQTEQKERFEKQIVFVTQ